MSDGAAHPSLAGAHVVLGVTGSIACYRAIDVARQLRQGGALVDVVMTEAACQFVTPLTFRSITHRPVITNLFDAESEFSVNHVRLAQEADVVVVAPATADVVAKLALGLADDFLTTTCLATRAPLLVAPAMNTRMYTHPATQENLATLEGRGARIVGPVDGPLAEDMSGRGRLSAVEDIVTAVAACLAARHRSGGGPQADLAGRSVVVTAGGTREPLDPVRFIGNRSSGKMGYALAEAARDRGAAVTLICGTVAAPPPGGVRTVRVETVTEMLATVTDAVRSADALIMAAAPADFRPATAATQKIKKVPGQDELTVNLVRNQDILATVKGEFVKVGFAAETEDLLVNARQKLASKGCDLIVANDVTAPDSGFGSDTNRVVLIDAEGQEELPLLSKRAASERILDRVGALLARSAHGRLAVAKDPGA